MDEPFYPNNPISDATFDKLIDFGHEAAAALASLSDEGSNMDTGTSGEYFEIFVIRDGIEFQVSITPYRHTVEGQEL